MRGTAACHWRPARLEREARRNVELMWLTGRLAPDFKAIADFRRDNVAGIWNVCRRFVMLCRDLKLFSEAVVDMDSSKFWHRIFKGPLYARVTPAWAADAGLEGL